MSTKSQNQKPSRPPRQSADDIDDILAGYGSRAEVVQLWRRLEGTQDRWIYLGRLSPHEVGFDLVARRFGGGRYRAKLLGRWDRVKRREEYFEQVHFGIAKEGWPITDETRARIAAFWASAESAF